MKDILKNFIEEKAEFINTLSITDYISDDTLKEICDEYYYLKTNLDNKCDFACYYHCTKGGQQKPQCIEDKKL